MAEESQVPRNIDVKVTKEIKPKDPNLFLMEWINIHNFNDLEDSKMNLKLTKNKNFLNPKLLIKTNDYKLENGFVTITVQPTLDGLKKMNKFSYHAIALIKQNMEEKEAKLKDLKI